MIYKILFLKKEKKKLNKKFFNARFKIFTPKKAWGFGDIFIFPWRCLGTPIYTLLPENIRFAGVMINRRDAAQHKPQTIHGIAKLAQSSQAWYNNPIPNKPWFLRICRVSFFKTLWEKEQLLVTSNFFLFPQCFLPFWRTFCYFDQS